MLALSLDDRFVGEEILEMERRRGAIDIIKLSPRCMHAVAVASNDASTSLHAVVACARLVHRRIYS